MASKEQISAYLYAEWDPLEIQGLAPEDEYSYYAHEIYEALAAGGSIDVIFQILRNARIEEMLMPADDEKDWFTATGLISI